MLDPETRRRIDTARDILVGKVPDPKSQVEQITIALIYKFMDDMDAESEELGGKRTFFAGEYERYGWAKLMATGISGFEMLNLYGEAIAKMPENPGIPALFRDIFKNAYLPYRDPETLKAFLKVIDDFTYDHSERLGDAFEYLLSVLGSQGDAGQFRTPRHIIDFMVAIVDPKKDERILDPACGTAGFLISAYKHILAANSRDGRPGAALSPEDRKRLMNNVHGYDISPDMVRLSLVNLYLHGFNDPHVDEYDTLTSEDHWNEYYNVILANPPFMSPKGGIRPHKRFSVQSNRSEVLFVDYIAEHLSPGGRAAVIVPEGVIFQSGRAYKQLRKLLVEEYLAGVISLPAGVFNPYSGVKTSILWLDKNIAKQSDSVLFVKIEADGFDLGAQRKEIKRSDLPSTLEGILSYKDALASGNGQVSEAYTNLALVSREQIAIDGQYSLIGERYKAIVTSSSRHPMVPLAELCDYIRGVTYSKADERDEPGHKILRANNIDLFSASLNLTDVRFISDQVTVKPVQNLKKNDILICAASGSIDHIGKAAFSNADTDYYVGGFMAILRCKEAALPKYLFYMINSPRFKDYVGTSTVGANIRNLNAGVLGSFEIPLPPLPIQEAIVAEVESYQRIIDGARQVVANWRPRIDVDPEWPVVKLGEVFFKVTESVVPADLKIDTINYIGLENIGQGDGELVGKIESTPKDIKSTKTVFQAGDLLYGKLRPNLNKVYFAPFSGICSTDIFVLRSNPDHINTQFYSYLLLSEWFNVEVLKGLIGAQLPRVGYSHFATIPIPVPSLKIQQAILADVQLEKAMVQANRDLISLFEQKIKDRIAHVWGE